MSDEELEELLNQYLSLIPLMILLNLIPLELLMLMGLDALLMGADNNPRPLDTTHENEHVNHITKKPYHRHIPCKSSLNYVVKHYGGYGLNHDNTN